MKKCCRRRWYFLLPERCIVPVPIAFLAIDTIFAIITPVLPAGFVMGAGRSRGLMDVADK